MITQAEIDEAEAAVEKAEQALDVAESYHHQAGGERAVMELRAARFDAHGARDRVRQLKSRWAAEHAGAARRAEAEANFPDKARRALAKQLAADRDAAVAAIAAAEKAAAEALEKVAAYSDTVRGAAADLVGRGLDASNGQGLGGTVGGVVHLDGETWQPADAASVLAAVTASVVRARDARHPFAAARWEQLGTLAQKAAQDALLARAAGR
ncbi:hypothetical protein ACF090_13210 [Streptomyces sp. NPDC014892]|uniref:hypothetical protein n=1 Tax=Streptomyces sp. NPDC014892 TaxID=3364930 RepID=UPI003701F314